MCESVSSSPPDKEWKSIFIIASPERGGGPPLGGGEVLSCNLLCNVLECILFDICEDPSVSAAHCQLPFQGSLIFLKRFVI